VTKVVVVVFVDDKGLALISASPHGAATSFTAQRMFSADDEDDDDVNRRLLIDDDDAGNGVFRLRG
jgi:hypothetical protein